MQTRFQTSAFTIGQWQQLVSSNMHDCMELIPAWIQRMVETNGTENYTQSQHLCVTRQDALACRSVNLGNENKSDWTMERWIEFFSMPSLSLASANEGFTIILNKWQEVLNGRDRNLKMEWEQFILRIENILATKVSNVMQVIPDREIFSRCISVASWNRLISANQVLVLVPELSASCNVTHIDELRNFIVAMAYLTKIAFTNNVRDESLQAEKLTYFITTPVRVYNKWLFLTKNKRVRRSLTLSPDGVNDLRRRLALLVDGNNSGYGRTDIFILNYGRQLSNRQSNFFLRVTLQETNQAFANMQECLNYSNRVQCQMPLDNLFFSDYYEVQKMGVISKELDVQGLE